MAVNNVNWTIVTKQRNQYLQDLAAKKKREAAQAKVHSTSEQLFNAVETAYHTYTAAQTNEYLAQQTYNINPTGANATALYNAHQTTVAAKKAYETAQQKYVQFTSPLVTAHPKAITAAKAAATTAKNTGGGTSKDSNSSTAPSSKQKFLEGKQYQFNIPMVKTAYFSALTSNPMQEGVPEGLAGTFQYNDGGKQAFSSQSGKYVSRGAIQMSRSLQVPLSQVAQGVTPKGTPTPYGFRFLYNPNEINMTWGVVSGIDPSWYATNAATAATPLTPASQASTISFNLFLNRIDDFNYIDENGLIDKSHNPYPTVQPPSDKELQMLYQKGTMYDLEYLMRSLQVPGVMWKNVWTGNTSDSAWLPITPFELHLGAGMKYNVRLMSLSVTHGMFNSRMVPITSSVNITVARWPEVFLGGQAPTTRSKGK